MDAGRGSYVCGLVLGVAVGTAGTHLLVARPRPAVPPLLDVTFEPTASESPADQGSLPLPSLKEFAPESSTVHALATEPAESTPAPLPTPEAPRALPEVAATPLTGVSREEHELRAFIREELHSLAASEHDIWYETLRELSREDATEILRIWKLTHAGDLPLSSREIRQMAALPEEPSAPPPTPEHTTLLRPSEENLPRESPQLALSRENLANVGTPGYKRRERIAASPTGSPSTLVVNTSQGNIVQTGRPFDCAIEGAGFFQVTCGSEILLTRCGRLVLDEKRRLAVAHQDGQLCPLMPEVTVPENCERLIIAADGHVTDSPYGQKIEVSLGRISLLGVFDPSALEPVGAALFRVTSASGPARELPASEVGIVRQRCIEESNVDAQREESLLKSFRPSDHTR